jgi:hypothetical protein
MRVIDILIEVSNVQNLDQFNSSFASIGNEYKEDFGIIGRRNDMELYASVKLGFITLHEERALARRVDQLSQAPPVVN